MLLFINYYKPMTFIHEKYTTQYILNNAIQNLNATIYIYRPSKEAPTTETASILTVQSIPSFVIRMTAVLY